ncbi:MAG: hypothetical protein V4543_01015 [Bacteroidota bacterium]
MESKYSYKGILYKGELLNITISFLGPECITYEALTPEGKFRLLPISEFKLSGNNKKQLADCVISQLKALNEPVVIKIPEAKPANLSPGLIQANY